MRQMITDHDAESFDDADLFDEHDIGGEDSATAELAGCLDRMVAEIGYNPELLDDLRWELELMNIRLGRAHLH